MAAGAMEEKMHSKPCKSLCEAAQQAGLFHILGSTGKKYGDLPGGIFPPGRPDLCAAQRRSLLPGRRWPSVSEVGSGMRAEMLVEVYTKDFGRGSKQHCHCEERSDVAISWYNPSKSGGMTAVCTGRLPRPLRGLAMTQNPFWIL